MQKRRGEDIETNEIINKKKRNLMNECVIIVDNSNIWIEGMKYSAKKKGLVSIDGKEACDFTWRIDFGKLLSQVADGKKIRKAILVGSEPPKNDSLWNIVKRSGFEVTVHDRNAENKEKAVDTELVAQGVELICTTPPAVLKILSGDSDFLPLVQTAARRGWETEMWAFHSSYRVVGSVATSVDRIQPLDVLFDEIGYCR